MGNTNPNANSKAKGGASVKRGSNPGKRIGPSGPKKGKAGSGYTR